MRGFLNSLGALHLEGDDVDVNQWGWKIWPYTLKMGLSQAQKC